MAKTKELTLEEKLKEAIIPKEEQPYEIPENWEWVKLGKITDIISGGTPSTEKKEYYENGIIPWITPKDLSKYKSKYIFNGNKNITELGLKNSSARLLPKNSVLLSSRAPIGYVVICKQEVTTNQGFKSFKPSNTYIPEFLYYYLSNSKGYLESIATGTTFKELSGEKVKIICFPLPSLEEQKRIVEKLDSMFEKINRAKELIQEAKENIENRKESILNKAFRGELTVEWRKNNQTEDAIELLKSINDEKIKNWEQECVEAEKNGKKKPSKAKIEEIQNMIISKEEEPYEVPKNWKWVKLGKITNIISGGTPSTEKKENYENGTIPWITPKDLSKYKSKYILSGNKNITELGLKNSSARLLPKNSVLLSSRAPIGYVVICKQEVATNQGFKSFEPSFLYIPEFLYYYLLNSKGYLESIATGTTFKELSGEKVKTIYFPLPPLKEQKEIVRILDEILEKESKIKELIELEEAIELLEKSILDKAFRGKLGTQNKDDEPAIKLLKKIL
ncbi:restriction endonuclease subunit S [Fusobacterium varium]|uniref:restriction endonuclease subunit S n=1 Tax=Fusobacterium varium TaxID=856 RepID=UPI000E50BC08|nr:restriction endonuclease subunit S [Fusobacterium varium]RHG37906.1 restriction endonuclease subunit S [Fusobacterium varium]